MLTFETAFRWPLFQIHFGGKLLYYIQAKVKGIFKMLTTRWKSLTPAQILAWNLNLSKYTLFLS